VYYLRLSHAVNRVFQICLIDSEDSL